MHALTWRHAQGWFNLARARYHLGPGAVGQTQYASTMAADVRLMRVEGAASKALVQQRQQRTRRAGSAQLHNMRNNVHPSAAVVTADAVAQDRARVGTPRSPRSACSAGACTPHQPAHGRADSAGFRV